MERNEIIFRLKNRGYSYPSLALIFNVSKQRIYELYWIYWKAHQEESNRTCDVCGKAGSDVKWYLFKIKVKACSTCFASIEEHRRRKWKH